VEVAEAASSAEPNPTEARFGLHAIPASHLQALCKTRSLGERCSCILSPGHGMPPPLEQRQASDANACDGSCKLVTSPHLVLQRRACGDKHLVEGGVGVPGRQPPCKHPEHSARRLACGTGHQPAHESVEMRQDRERGALRTNLNATQAFEHQSCTCQNMRLSYDRKALHFPQKVGYSCAPVPERPSRMMVRGGWGFIVMISCSAGLTLQWDP
jgi:hypothetical protein